MRIVSRIINVPFWKYHLLEHVVLSVLAAAAVPPLLLWVMMRTRRSEFSNDLMDVVRDNGHALILAALVAIAFINVINWLMRRSRFIVSPELAGDGKALLLEVRGNSADSLSEQEVPMSLLRWERYKSPALPFMTSYVGYRFFNGQLAVGVLLTDHFTWEDQKRRVKDFLAALSKQKPMVG